MLQIKKASTDVSIYLFIQNSSTTPGAGLTGLVYNAAGLICYYVRPLAAAAQLTLATQTVTGAHSDGGLVEVDATNMPGVYRLDLSDAVCATGVNSVVVMLKGAANMAPVLKEIELVAYDPQDAASMGLSAVNANLKQIDGQATNGHNATLNLKSLDIENSAGNAIRAVSTATDTSGIYAKGDGDGHGLQTEGGTAGAGIYAEGGTNGDGIACQGHGVGGGIVAHGGDTAGPGMYAQGGDDGPGFQMQGGPSDGEGLVVTSQAANRDAMRLAGNGSGRGINAVGGATGDGIRGAGGSTSGHGIVGAATDGHGMDLVGAGTGVDLKADNVAPGVADAVWDEARADHTTVGTYGHSPDVIRGGVAQAGAAGTITLDTGASSTDDFYNNQIVAIITGTGVGQSRIISDYVGSTRVATVNGNWVTNPDNTSVFVIFAFGAIPGASAPTAAEVADAVWDEATAGHTTSGTFGEQAKTDVDAILAGATAIEADTQDIQARIPAALTGAGNMKVDVLAISGDTTAADNLETAADGGSFNLGGGGVVAASVTGAVGSVTGAVGSVTGAVGSVTGNVGGNVTGSVGSLATQAKADVNAEADTALADYDPPTRAELTSDTNSILAKLLKYVQLMLRKDSAIATDNGTEVTAINADGGSGGGAFANTTDSQEALRDRGDAAWVTGTAPLDAAGTRAAVGLASANLDTQLSGIQSDTDNIQTRIPAALVSGRMDASVGAMASGVVTATAIATDAIDADALAADAVAEIQSGLATSAEATSILSKLLKYVQLILRKDAGIATDNSAEVTAINADGGSGGGAFDNTTDSQEALHAEISLTRDDTEDIQTRLPAALVSGRMDSSVGAMATDTLTAAALAADAVTEIQSGLATSASIAGLNNLSAAQVNAEVDTALADINLDHLVKIAVDTDFPTTVHLGSVIGHLADNGTSASFDRTTDSLEAIRDRGDAAWTGSGAAPTAADIADAVWEEAIADHSGTSGSTAEALAAAGGAGDPWITALPGAYSSGQAGYILGTNLNATVSSRASQTSVDTIDDLLDTEVAAIKTVVDAIKVKTDQLVFTITNKVDASIQAAGDFAQAAADKAWATASRTLTAFGFSVTVGTNSDKTGYALTSAYDPAQTAAQAGDAMALTSGERTTLAAVIWNALTSGLTTVGSIGKLLVDNINATISSRLPTSSYTAPLDAAGTRTAVGLASANLDTQLTAIDDLLDTEVAAIKTVVDAIKLKTDGLPSDPADESSLQAAIAGLASTLAGLSIPTANQNADALLDRANGIETGYTLRQSHRLMLSALVGKLSGAATTAIAIRDINDTKNRLSATVDSSGNRSAVTVDAT